MARTVGVAGGLVVLRATGFAGRAATFRLLARFDLAMGFWLFALRAGLAFLFDRFDELRAATRLRPGAVRLATRPAFRFAMFSSFRTLTVLR
jgi:hypothetical protein